MIPLRPPPPDSPSLFPHLDFEAQCIRISSISIHLNHPMLCKGEYCCLGIFSSRRKKKKKRDDFVTQAVYPDNGKIQRSFPDRDCLKRAIKGGNSSTTNSARKFGLETSVSIDECWRLLKLCFVALLLSELQTVLAVIAGIAIHSSSETQICSFWYCLFFSDDLKRMISEERFLRSLALDFLPLSKREN